jgi:hypothetical protein
MTDLDNKIYRYTSKQRVSVERMQQHHCRKTRQIYPRTPVKTQHCLHSHETEKLHILVFLFKKRLNSTVYILSVKGRGYRITQEFS